MGSRKRSLLCVTPSSTQTQILQEMAARVDLDFISCVGEDDANAFLASDTSLSALVISHHLSNGDSLRLIESLRLSPRYATLPIAFVMSDRNFSMAQNALHSGATEIFLRAETEFLFNFICDWADPAQGASFSGRALLVEDTPSQVEFVSFLCRALGFEVDAVSDVESAIHMLKTQRYQIVISDVVLSGAKSGISLVKHIRQEHEYHQPILMVSSFDDVPRRLMALKSGADDFLSKPFAPEEFMWRVRKILHSQAQVDLGLAAAEVVEGRKEIASMLSPREYEIFKAMLLGRSDKEIAVSHGISFWTVRSHVQQIFTKTGALNRRELMVRYLHPSD